MSDPHAARPSTVQTPKSAHRMPIEEPIELVDDLLEEVPGTDQLAPQKSKINLGVEGNRRELQFKRSTNVSGFGATRVKSFHGKYSDQGVEHLDDAINAWLDAHPEAEVKFVTSTVHTFEGKIREPALVLNVWY